MRLTELVTPLKPLEAMAMGRPIVASDVGGLAELIQHDVTGILVPAESRERFVDAAARLLGDAELRARLGGRRRGPPSSSAQLAADGRALRRPSTRGGVGAGRMRVLVLSTVYPNPKQPAFGVFVHERMRRVARHAESAVVAPVPWFPGNSCHPGPALGGSARRRGARRRPRLSTRAFLCMPRFAKWLDGALYAASLAPVLARLRRRFPFDLIDAHFAYPDGHGRRAPRRPCSACPW